MTILPRTNAATIGAILLAASLLNGCALVAPADPVEGPVIALARHTDLSDVQAVQRVLGVDFRRVARFDAMDLQAADECRPGAETRRFRTTAEHYEASGREKGVWSTFVLRIFFRELCGGGFRGRVMLSASGPPNNPCRTLDALSAEFSPVQHYIRMPNAPPAVYSLLQSPGAGTTAELSLTPAYSMWSMPRAANGSVLSSTLARQDYECRNEMDIRQTRDVVSLPVVTAEAADSLR